MARLALITLLLPLFLHAPVAAAPAAPNAMTAGEIADALTSRDPAQCGRGLEEMCCANAATCEELGNEINRRGVREAETILAAVGQSQSPNALIAAFVALESEARDVRNSAVDAMLSVPFTVSARCGAEFLIGRRRERLFELLTAPDDLAMRCDAVRINHDGSINEDPRIAINLAILADRFFGTAGFTGTLRGLATVMQGADIAMPPEIGPPPAKLPGEPQPVFSKRLRRWEALRMEHESKMEDFQIALRRRQTAEMMFRSIWVADLTQFNFVVVAGFRQRQAAVTRIKKRLDAMENQVVELGERKFRGMRCGDHLMELWSSDVAEFKAASYLLMRAMAGEPIELQGEGYTKAISELNGYSRRQFAELRKNLKAWWTQYRTQSEPR